MRSYAFQTVALYCLHMPHFYASDLIALALAFLLGVPFLLIPGYGIGWWLNLFQFRSCPAAMRWSFAIVIAIAALPILLYLPFRLLGVHAMHVAIIFLIISGVFACSRRGIFPRISEVPRAAMIACCLWIILAVCLMLDLEQAGRLYPSTVIIDTSFRSQIISSIAESNRLPAPSYFFHPGHDVAFRYHYMYFIVPALMVQATRGLITAGMALVSLSIWTGLAMFAVVSIFGRFVWRSTEHERLIRFAWLLLAVDGLDLVPAGTGMVWRAIHGKQLFLNPDIGLWNGFGAVFSWLSTAVWSTHHIGGLVACVLGCVLLWDSRDSAVTSRWTAASVAAIAFASAAGTSIFVTLIFAIFLFIVVIELFLNSPRHVPPVLFSGVLAFILALPFLMDALVPATPNPPAVFHFAIRPFGPIVLLCEKLGVSSRVWNLSNLAALPINFLMELGVFAVGGIWWLLERKHRAPEYRYRDDLVIGLAAVSLIIPSFVWSGMEISNDLGFRGVLPAQFVLIFCTAEFLSRYWKAGNQKVSGLRLSRLAVIFLAIGIGSNILEIFILRGAIGTTSANTILRGDTMRVDTSAERLAQLRDAYAWIRNHTAQNAVVQENPVTTQMIPQGEYSQRRAAVYGSNPSYMIGENHAEYLAVLDQVKTIFTSESTVQTITPICRRLGIEYLVMQEGDPAWSSPRSYASQLKPLYSTPLVRIFPCGKQPELTAQSNNGH